MTGKFFDFGYRIIGHPSKFGIERQFLNLVMFSFALTCFLASIVNVSEGMSLLHTITVFFITILFASCYYLARIKRSVVVPTYIFCIMAIFVVPTAVWITNGGNSGSYPYFVGSIIFGIWMILHGRIRIAALLVYYLVILSLLFINFKHPELIAGYPTRASQFADTNFAALFAILMNALCIALIMSAYNAKQAQLLEAHQKQLAHTEKLVAQGTLVSEVAHEVNNPNNSLMLDIEIMRKIMEGILPVLDDYAADRPGFEISGLPYAELKEEISALGDRMKRNSERIKRIVSDLRLFAKNEVMMTDSVIMNDVVKSGLTVADHVIRKCTKNFHVDLGEDIPVIKGNTQYLEQVIINLVKNACQALSDFEKGVFITTFFDKEINNIVLTIRDEGKGMGPETLENLFTPFITTKGKEGTGLGLSICNNIVKSHGGKIEVESNAGKGTTMRVVLPGPPRAA
jgi:signal transduction histidine kinase